MDFGAPMAYADASLL